MRTGDDSIDYREDVEPWPFRDESGKVEQDRGFSSLIVRFEICARQIGGVPGLPYVDTSQWGGLMLDIYRGFIALRLATRRLANGARVSREIIEHGKAAVALPNDAAYCFASTSDSAFIEVTVLPRSK
jgi:hypothetical protein